MTSTEAMDKVSARRWRIYGRPFDSQSALAEAVRRELLKANGVAHRAIYDAAGNCRTCGECGRCPGYHTEEERRATA